MTAPLEEITEFFTRLANVKMKQCPNARIYFLYHKRDLNSVPLLSYQIQALTRFVKANLPNLRPKVEIFPTSITENYFLSTMHIFGEIISHTIARGVVSIKQEAFAQAELELHVLFELNRGIKYSISFIEDKFHLPRPARCSC